MPKYPSGLAGGGGGVVGLDDSFGRLGCLHEGSIGTSNLRIRCFRFLTQFGFSGMYGRAVHPSDHSVKISNYL